MPDYSCQYPDYFANIKKKKAEPLIKAFRGVVQSIEERMQPFFKDTAPKHIPQNTPVGHRNARVRISRVRPKNLLLFIGLPKREKVHFYSSHNCNTPVDYKYGAWAKVR